MRSNAITLSSGAIIGSFKWGKIERPRPGSSIIFVPLVISTMPGIRMRAALYIDHFSDGTPAYYGGLQVDPADFHCTIFIASFNREDKMPLKSILHMFEIAAVGFVRFAYYADLKVSDFLPVDPRAKKHGLTTEEYWMARKLHEMHPDFRPRRLSSMIAVAVIDSAPRGGLTEDDFFAVIVRYVKLVKGDAHAVQNVGQ